MNPAAVAGAAEMAVSLASDGCFGVARCGRPSAFVWRGSLGPRSSRFRSLGGCGEAVAPLLPWNKSLWPRSRLGGVRSGVGKGPVREGFSRLFNHLHSMYRN